MKRYGLLPPRAFEIITDGYPGTPMASYRHLPESQRWALVELVRGMRTGGL